jgi:hypothetical protein
MRRGSVGAVLFVLALLAQILAPAAATKMLVQAPDAFGHVLLCSSDAGAGGGDSTPGNGPSHHDHCSLCEIAFGGCAPFAARSIATAAPYIAATTIVWRFKPGAPALSRVDLHRLPRGPPFLA